MVVLALVGFLVLQTYRVRKKMKKVKQFKNIILRFQEGRVNELDPDATVREQTDLLPYDAAWEIKREAIQLGKGAESTTWVRGLIVVTKWLCMLVRMCTISVLTLHRFTRTYPRVGKQLGVGAFGRVVFATVKGLGQGSNPEGETEAALKMVKSQIDPVHLESLMVEMKILSRLGKHVNIVNLLGANSVNLDRGT